MTEFMQTPGGALSPAFWLDLALAASPENET